VDDQRSGWELLHVSGDDPEAFRVLYHRHAGAILGFLYRRTACPETAADVMAETFSQAYLSPVPRGTGKEPPVQPKHSSPRGSRNGFRRSGNGSKAFVLVRVPQ
jgi:hypothetical protein